MIRSMPLSGAFTAGRGGDEFDTLRTGVRMFVLRGSMVSPYGEWRRMIRTGVTMHRWRS